MIFSSFQYYYCHPHKEVCVRARAARCARSTPSARHERRTQSDDSGRLTPIPTPICCFCGNLTPIPLTPTPLCGILTPIPLCGDVTPCPLLGCTWVPLGLEAAGWLQQHQTGLIVGWIVLQEHIDPLWWHIGLAGAATPIHTQHHCAISHTNTTVW